MGGRGSGRRSRLTRALLEDAAEPLASESQNPTVAVADPLTGVLDAADTTLQDAKSTDLREYRARMAPGLAALRQGLADLKLADTKYRLELEEAEKRYGHRAWQAMDPPLVRRLAREAHTSARTILGLLKTHSAALTRKIEVIEGRAPTFFKHYLVPTQAKNDQRDINGLVATVQAIPNMVAHLREKEKEIRSCNPRPAAKVALPSPTLRRRESSGGNLLPEGAEEIGPQVITDFPVFGAARMTQVEEQ